MSESCSDDSPEIAAFFCNIPALGSRTSYSDRTSERRVSSLRRRRSASKALGPPNFLSAQDSTSERRNKRRPPLFVTQGELRWMECNGSKSRPSRRKSCFASVLLHKAYRLCVAPHSHFGHKRMPRSGNTYRVAVLHSTHKSLCLATKARFNECDTNVIPPLSFAAVEAPEFSSAVSSSFAAVEPPEFSSAVSCHKKSYSVSR
mmetsp:Transcript_154044/g.272027  ORF Transcript_154044/g.272027 Transcript_154044/m.272027 type:complete len:203 (-) Transcript_154044:207-815(-)